jgi:uncharacterized lipoprotein YddW (UPF0748 family)
MKRTLVFLLIIFNLFCQNVLAQDVYAPYEPAKNEIIFNQAMFRIDVVDPVASTNWKGINYPGLRGANQLVIYSPSFGYRTNTNEFGTEAIVVGDTVVSLSGADSLIPANGFVISGHGQAKKWMNENLMVGSKIYLDLDKKIITSYTTSDTFLFAAKEKINEVQEMMNYYSHTTSNYNPKHTEQCVNKAKDFISKAQRNSEESQKYSTKAIEYANSALSTVIPYNPDELKGVWIRPTYFSKDAIETVLNNLQASGVNNVFIETYYHGKTIFPSQTMERYGFIKQYEDYVGFDPLKIWISEAHKRGIKVHIWFQTYYVGNKSPETNSQYILAVHPEWSNYQKKNADSETPVYSVSEHNGYFIDPANPEVQKFLYELLCEIVEKYKPDGINLDYIRYPQSLAKTYSNYDQSNWGYTQYARNEFKDMYGVDPIELTTEDPLWDYWRFYRCSKVTNFVRKVSKLCRANNVTITTVIFPNKTSAMDTKLQDWKNWSINNFVDGFTPLFLTCDDKTEINLIEEVLRNKSANTKLYAGLFVTFMNGSTSDLIKQIHAARKYGLNGLIIFDYAHFTNNYVEVLTESVFRPMKRDIVITDSDVYKRNGMVQFKTKEKVNDRR